MEIMLKRQILHFNHKKILLRKFEELVDNQVDKLVDKLSKTEKIVFDAIKDNPHLSQPELAIRCNVGKTTIQNVIIKLKELNLIERVGSNKTGYWEIKE